jgi:hypothetical protein
MRFHMAFLMRVSFLGHEVSCLGSMFHSSQRRLGLGQPERHVHGAVQLDGGRQFGTGLIQPAELGIEDTKAIMTMGQERAHAKFIGQGEYLLVTSFSLLALQRIAPHGNLAEEAQGIGLMAPFLVLAGECQRPLAEGMSFLQAVSQHLHLP